MIGSRSPGSQIQMVSPIAIRSDAAASSGTSARRTNGGRSSPTISTTMAPPVSAISGDSSR